MKTKYCIVTFFCVLLTVPFLKAAPAITDESVVKVSNTDLEKGTPTFASEKNGLILEVNVPSATDDLGSLVVTIILINKTGASLRYRTSNGLDGVDMHVFDDSGHELPVSEYFKEQRWGALGMGSETIMPNAGIKVTLPLNKFVPIARLGKYTIAVDWADMEMGGAGWERSAVSRIQLKGSFVASKSGTKISITPISNAQ